MTRFILFIITFTVFLLSGKVYFLKAQEYSGNGSVKEEKKAPISRKVENIHDEKSSSKSVQDAKNLVLHSHIQKRTFPELEPIHSHQQPVLSQMHDHVLPTLEPILTETELDLPRLEEDFLFPNLVRPALYEKEHSVAKQVFPQETLMVENTAGGEDIFSLLDNSSVQADVPSSLPVSQSIPPASKVSESESLPTSDYTIPDLSEELPPYSSSPGHETVPDVSLPSALPEISLESDPVNIPVESSENTLPEPEKGSEALLPDVSETADPFLPSVTPELPERALPYKPDEKEVRSPRENLSSSDGTSLPSSLPETSREVASSSVNKDLVTFFTQVPEEALGDLKTRLTLGEFLERLPADNASVRRGVQAYWEHIQDGANYIFWKKQSEIVQNLAVSTSENQLQNTAAAATKASMEESLAAFRSGTVILGEIGGFPREVFGTDIPHTGKYDTRYEDFVEIGQGTRRLAFLNRMVHLRYEQWNASASAYRAAEYVLQEQKNQKASLKEILPSLSVMQQKHEAMFHSLIQYNMAILDYALEVSYKRGKNLAPLLVVQESSVQPSAHPSSDVPVNQSDRTSQETFQTDLPQEKDILQQNSDFQAPETHTSVPVPSLPETVSEDEHSINNESPLQDNSILETDNPGMIPIYDGALPDPVLQETPPPSSEFQPVGGERGSISTLPSAPAGNDASLSAPNSKSSDGVSFPRPQDSGMIFHNDKNFLRPFPEREFFNRAENDFISKIYTSHALSDRKVSDFLFSVSFSRTSDLRTSEKNVTETMKFSLADVFSQINPSEREMGAKLYWRYSVLQTQRMVLQYQLALLENIRQKLLQNTQLTTEGVKISGLRLTAAAQTLIAQQKSLEADSWQILMTLSRMGIFPDEITDLPVATTLPNSGTYSLHLDKMPPGSDAHIHALRRARHLDFCVNILHEMEKNMESLLPFTGPSDISSSSIPDQNMDLPSYLLSLENARTAMTVYLRLIYTVNSTLVSCTFTDNAATLLPPGELVKRLTQ
ncbi:MAG: hypothetical protein Q4C96_08755 [Planctomycetia bacterium]|nr:hypothetical protein [Planctomycetia bacterium]